MFPHEPMKSLDEWNGWRTKAYICFVIDAFIIGLYNSLIYTTQFLYIEQDIEPAIPTFWYGLSMGCFYGCTVLVALFSNMYYDRTKKVRKIMLVAHVFTVIASVLYLLHYSIFILLIASFVYGTLSMANTAATAELSNIYDDAQLTGKLTVVRTFLVIGELTAPCLLLALVKLDVRVGTWHLDFGNSPALIIGLLALVYCALIALLLRNLAREYAGVIAGTRSDVAELQLKASFDIASFDGAEVAPYLSDQFIRDKKIERKHAKLAAIAERKRATTDEDELDEAQVACGELDGGLSEAHTLLPRRNTQTRSPRRKHKDKNREESSGSEEEIEVSSWLLVYLTDTKDSLLDRHFAILVFVSTLCTFCHFLTMQLLVVKSVALMNWNPLRIALCRILFLGANILGVFATQIATRFLNDFYILYGTVLGTLINTMSMIFLPQMVANTTHLSIELYCNAILVGFLDAPMNIISRSMVAKLVPKKVRGITEALRFSAFNVVYAVTGFVIGAINMNVFPTMILLTALNALSCFLLVFEHSFYMLDDYILDFNKS